jgi:hypothetical protein
MDAGRNSPAFPLPEQGGTRFANVRITGITKLEYFAANALQGILSNPNYTLSAAEAAQEAVKVAVSLCGQPEMAGK